MKKRRKFRGPMHPPPGTPGLVVYVDPEPSYMTQKLVDADGVRHFGPSVRISELPEAEARAIFGDAVYEGWRDAQKTGRRWGTCVVTSIGDRSTPAIPPKDE